jgi:hypothetical protein
VEDLLPLSPAAELSDEADRIQSLLVTREGKRPLAALVAAVLVAALLAACGGSDSDSSSSTEATAGDGATATTGTTASSDDTAQDDSRPQNGNGSQSQGDDKGQADSRDERPQNQPESGAGSGSKDVATPLKVSGGGAEQFRVKGGDNSIQDFGGESDESELQEAAEVVHGFFVARAEEQWSTACSYLAKSNVGQLEQIARQAKSASTDCAAGLAAFTRPLPAELEREITTVDAGSLRREGEQGFLVYYGAGGDTYAMPLQEEGGSWKVTALSGVILS